MSRLTPHAASHTPFSKFWVEFSLAFKFALRELRGGLRGFYVFLACIALGVAAIFGVNAVALSITSGIAEEGKTLLGGDMALTTVQRRLTAAELQWITTKGTISESATLRAMARMPDGSDQTLVELKAVDKAWPLIGALQTEPNATTGLTEGVVVDPILLTRLGLKVNGLIKIGSSELPIKGIIKNEPDRISDGLSLGPRILISLHNLEKTQLIQPGSLVKWTTRVNLNVKTDKNLAAVIKQGKEQFPEAGWRIRSRDNAAPALTRNVERFSQFLTLVGLTALIVGGVGVANAVRAFLETKTYVIASFKSLGAPARFVFWVYLIQILLLAFIGILMGLAVGSLLPLLARNALDGILPVGGTVFHFSALINAILYGFLTALAFTLWPLGQARDVPAITLFRNEGRGHAPWPRLIYQGATVLVVTALIALAISQANDKSIATTFIIGIGASIILLRGVSWLIAWGARKMPQVKSTPLRLALGNIYRPGALTPSVVLSLGLGLALLVSLTLIDSNLRNQISSNIPKQAPDFFFVDIQSAEFEPFKQQLKELAPKGEVQTVPMLRGRIISINDVAARDIKAKEGGQWVLRGDRGLTYAAKLPPNATIAEGEWWDENHEGENLVSFSAEEADELGVSINDKITVNVLGRNITARVVNLRHVEWQSMAINFVMVFSPNSFKGAPHAHMATLRVDKPLTLDEAENNDQTVRDGEILKAITHAFPTVTTVRVRDALNAVNSLIAQLATAIRAAALLALAASILVLGGALAAGNQARIHDAVVLKTLGAKRSTLMAAFISEYALLGAATALFSLLAGGLAAWFVIKQIMGFSFTFFPEIALFTILAALVFTIGFGLIGTWRVLGQKAAPVLREL